MRELPTDWGTCIFDWCFHGVGGLFAVGVLYAFVALFLGL